MNLQNLIDSETNITIAVKKNDLFELFNDFATKKNELEAQVKKAETTEIYYSPAQVSKMLQIDVSSLWRWEQKGILMGVRIGGKKRYRQSDINKIMEGGK